MPIGRRAFQLQRHSLYWPWKPDQRPRRESQDDDEARDRLAWPCGSERYQWPVMQKIKKAWKERHAEMVCVSAIVWDCSLLHSRKGRAGESARLHCTKKRTK